MSWNNFSNVKIKTNKKTKEVNNNKINEEKTGTETEKEKINVKTDFEKTIEYKGVDKEGNVDELPKNKTNPRKLSTKFDFKGIKNLTKSETNKKEENKEELKKNLKEKLGSEVDIVGLNSKEIEETNRQIKTLEIEEPHEIFYKFTPTETEKKVAEEVLKEKMLTKEIIMFKEDAQTPTLNDEENYLKMTNSTRVETLEEFEKIHCFAN